MKTKILCITLLVIIIFISGCKHQEQIKEKAINCYAEQRNLDGCSYRDIKAIGLSNKILDYYIVSLKAENLNCPKRQELNGKEHCVAIKVNSSSMRCIGGAYKIDCNTNFNINLSELEIKPEIKINLFNLE